MEVDFRKKWHEEFRRKKAFLKEWHVEHRKKTDVPLYSSVDLRDSQFKVVPVDHNVFSAGFNNLSKTSQRIATECFRHKILSIKKDTKIVALLAEPHTSNKYYLDHLFSLTKILQEAGFEVFPCVLEELPSPSVSLETLSHGQLKVFQALIDGNEFKVDAQKIDFVVMNNDLSSGLTTNLEKIKIPIKPSFSLGWYQRRKHLYLKQYETLISELSKELQWDPWLLEADYERIEGIDMKQGVGLDLIFNAIERVLSKIRMKYEEYGILRKPFVLLKYNAGTYGLGIMTLYSAQDIFTLNRKEREQMSYGKGKQSICDIIVQEGVPTTQRIDNCNAEPVIYLVGSKPVGGFVRIHCGQSEEENLNVPGMRFQPFALDPDFWNTQDETSALYGFLTSVSSLAVGYESEEYK